MDSVSDNINTTFSAKDINVDILDGKKDGFVASIETTGSVLSVAIAQYGAGRKMAVLCETNHLIKNSHDRLLAKSYSDLLNSLGIVARDIDAYFVSNGPGAFTGLRIGLSFVKGLAFATDKPVMLFNSLEAVLRFKEEYSDISESEASKAVIRHSHADKFYILNMGVTEFLDLSELKKKLVDIDTVMLDVQVSDKTISDQLFYILEGKRVIKSVYKATNLFAAFDNGCGYELSTGGRESRPFYKQEFIPNKKKS